jgi:hypothetical protein
MSRSGGIFRAKRKSPDERSKFASDAIAARDARKRRRAETTVFPCRSFFIYGSTSVADYFAAATMSIPQHYLTQLLNNLSETPISQLDQWLPDQWKLRDSSPLG